MSNDIFPVRREGWRWRVCEVGSDGIERPLPSALFWRWITAGRLSSELLRMFHTAVWEGQNR